MEAERTALERHGDTVVRTDPRPDRTPRSLHLARSADPVGSASKWRSFAGQKERDLSICRFQLQINLNLEKRCKKRFQMQINKTTARTLRAAIKLRAEVSTFDAVDGGRRG